MWLIKIIDFLVAPTTLFFILLVLGAFFIWSKTESKKRYGKVFVLIALIGFYLLSITPVADLFLFPLENPYSVCHNSSDRIVVLLGGVKDNYFSTLGLLEESSLHRVMEALRLYFNSPDSKIIVSGTNPLNPQQKTAEKVKNFLISLKVPPSDIITEANSRNTYQNAKEVKKIVENKQSLSLFQSKKIEKNEKVTLVTSSYHLPRAMYSFKKLGMNPVPCPAGFNMEADYNVFDFLPDPQNLKNCNRAFHEYLGMLYYRIRY